MSRRRWLVGFSLDPGLAPQSMHAEACRWRDLAFRGHTRPCWSYRGASRLAARWNRRRSPFGAYEVFGPVGKELDGAA